MKKAYCKQRLAAIDDVNAHGGVLGRPLKAVIADGASNDYAWSDITLDVNASPAARTNFGGTALNPGDKAFGSIKYGNAPYLSLGWGNHASRSGGLFFNTELGMMFTGKPDVALTTNNAVINATNAAAIEADKLKKDALDWFPIVKLGVGYTF